MGTLLDLASLVVVPSGYKEDKIYSVVPTDGSGDLDFTRASSATRVNSAGLIEKVRTNHILQSNSFDTTWLATDATITSGATDPNGGATAWTLANTANNGIIQQAATLTGLRSVSIFAKQGTHRYLLIGAYGGTNSYQSFDLQTGTITNGSNGRIENVGGGWYRCTSFGADGTTGGVQIFPSNISNGAATSTGSILIYQCQYESGDIATDYIPTTSAAVSVGMTANVPRLDYLNSSCPSLLLEPQRSNLVTNSEIWNGTGWIAESASVTPNSVISPSGYQDADTLTGTGSFSRLRQSGFTLADNTDYTVSSFLKAGTAYSVRLTFIGKDGVDTGYTFNLQDGTAESGAKIENYGNGWYRCSFTANSGTGATTPTARFASNDAGNTGGWTTGLTIYAWGAQLEAGSYPTSYIPTLGTSVTRVADAAFKTGISSLYGATEGVVYLETGDCFNNSDTSATKLFMVVQKDANNWFGIASGGSNAAPTIRFATNIAGTITTEGEPTGLSNSKIAVLYTASSIKVYQNGALVLTVNKSIGNYADIYFMVNSADDMTMPLKQFLIFPTALTDAECITLTTL